MLNSRMLKYRLQKYEGPTMLNTFNLILIMCGATGAVMVFGSILLLYLGAIKLSKQDAGHALEAEFKNQLKVNIRNPALGLFIIGFVFFGLALFFAKPEGVNRRRTLTPGHIVASI
jgi:hypothetical protein